MMHWVHMKKMIHMKKNPMPQNHDKMMYWILFHSYIFNDLAFDYYVYNTLENHDLYFEVLKHIGINRNIRISYHHYCQEDTIIGTIL